MFSFASPCNLQMPKSLVDLKVTWKILTRPNYCLQSALSQTIPQLAFIVSQSGESSFNLSSALRSSTYKHIDIVLRLYFSLVLYLLYSSLCNLA